MRDAVARLYLDQLVWCYSPYAVRRELYASLLRQVDKDAERFRQLCGLTPILDIVRLHYWEEPGTGTATGLRPLVHPVTQETISSVPSQEEVSRLRLALLSVAERMLR